MYSITINKDSEWYLAQVDGYEYLFARWESPESAQKELLHVIEMVHDHHANQVKIESQIKDFLFTHKSTQYAV